jgi:DNA-binding response OmpR family regulator
MTGKTQKRTILIVDDDERLRQAFARVMQEAGWGVHDCADGRAALDWLATGHRPTVVLLDQDMPVLNGQQFLSAIRAESEYAGLRIIRMSGREWRDEKTPFLEKPFLLGALFAAIEDQMALKGT